MENHEILRYIVDLTGIESRAFHRALLLEAVVWCAMIGAVIIDFTTGIRKAKVLKIPRDSHGFRRSFSKFGDYGKVTGMLMLFDLLAIRHLFASVCLRRGGRGCRLYRVSFRPRKSQSDKILGGGDDNYRRVVGQSQRP